MERGPSSSGPDMRSRPEHPICTCGHERARHGVTTKPEHRDGPCQIPGCRCRSYVADHKLLATSTQSGIGCSGWWADPKWQAVSASPQAKGLFVATKLYLHDTQKFRRVWMEVFPSWGLLGAPTKQILPDDITKGQWRKLLEAVGATPAEIISVLSKLGFPIP